MTQTFLKTLRYVPLPSTMDDALNKFDARSLDKDSSYHSTVLLPVSAEFRAALSPWILQNSFLDALEFKLVVDSPTYQYATEVGISPDFDDELTIKALSRVARFVKKLSFLRSTEHPEIQRLLCNTPSIERLYLEVIDRTSGDGAVATMMKMMTEHPTIRGRAVAANALAQQAFGAHGRFMFEPIIKNEALKVVRDLIVQQGAKNLDNLQILLSSFSTLVSLDKAIGYEERIRPMSRLPSPKGLEFYDEIFNMIESFFKSGDSRYIVRHPSLFGEIASFIDTFCMYGNAEDQNEFWSAYRKDLISPILQVIEEHFIVTRSHLDAIESDELKKSDPNYYYSGGDAKDDENENENIINSSDYSAPLQENSSSSSLSKEDSALGMPNRNSSTSMGSFTKSFNNFKQRILTPSDIRQMLIITKHWLSIFTAKFSDEFWIREDNPSWFIEDEMAKARRLRATLDSHDSSDDEDNDNDDDASNEIDAASGLPVKVLKSALCKMIDTGRKSLSHVPFHSISALYQTLVDPRLAQHLHRSEITYMKNTLCKFSQNVLVKFVRSRADTGNPLEALMRQMRAGGNAANARHIANLLANHEDGSENNNSDENNTPENTKSVLDYESRRWTPLMLSRDHDFIKMFVTTSLLKRTEENDAVPVKYMSEDQLEQRELEKKKRFAALSFREKKDNEKEVEYEVGSNQQFYQLLGFLLDFQTKNLEFTKQFVFALLDNGIMDYVVQDLDAVEEDSILRGKSRRWTIDQTAKQINDLIKKMTAIIASWKIDHQSASESEDAAQMTSSVFDMSNDTHRKWHERIYKNDDFRDLLHDAMANLDSSSDDEDAAWETDDDDEEN